MRMRARVSQGGREEKMRREGEMTSLPLSVVSSSPIAVQAG